MVSALRRYPDPSDGSDGSDKRRGNSRNTDQANVLGV